MSYDLEDQNKADDWKSTKTHKSELVIAYDTNTGNNALRPRILYTLYIGPNNDNKGHLIYKLSTDQILVTMKYESVPVLEDLIEVTNETNSPINKIQVDHVNNENSIIYVYIIFTKASLQLCTYYCFYKYLYECLYKKIFYIISIKVSLRLYTYYRLYLHF